MGSVRRTRDLGSHSRAVVFSGPPCSGKSTLAERISKDREIVWIEMDRVRVRLLPTSFQGKEDRNVAYRAMHLSAELLLTAGRNVILDATYARHEHRIELEEVCRRTGASLLVVECKISPDLALLRFKMGREQHPAVDLTAERVLMLAETFPYCGLGLIVDTAAVDNKSCLSAIECYLEQDQPTPLGAWSAAVFRYSRNRNPPPIT